MVGESHIDWFFRQVVTNSCFSIRSNISKWRNCWNGLGRNIPLSYDFPTCQEIVSYTSKWYNSREELAIILHPLCKFDFSITLIYIFRRGRISVEIYENLFVRFIATRTFSLAYALQNTTMIIEQKELGMFSDQVISLW